MADIDTGLNAWQMTSNHNRMMELQNATGEATTEEIEIAYFGGSAFRITSPLGITVMIDPWRNHPSRRWDWYFYDFPITPVDIGVSTHAHFDHDALHRLDANVLLDRLIGNYSFKDMAITGIAEKHATDSCCALYDFKKIHRLFHDVDIEPPNNPRSWDNCLIVVETGGLRILHWGDNRTELPESAWEQLGTIDIALIPVDNSQHVIGHQATEKMLERLNPHIIIPHHYYIWDVVQRQSTLQSAEPWVSKHDNVTRFDGARTTYSSKSVRDQHAAVHFFGDHVAFDKSDWHEQGKLAQD